MADLAALRAARMRWSRHHCGADGPGSAPTAPWTPCSRCSPWPPTSPPGCRWPASTRSWILPWANGFRATRQRGPRDRRMRWRCCPRTRPRAWSGMSSAWPGSPRGTGRCCATGTACWAPTRCWTPPRVSRPASPTDSTALAEERRLFYVAATRARRRLIATAVADQDTVPSRFLDELAGTEEELADRLAGGAGRIRATRPAPDRSGRRAASGARRPLGAGAHRGIGGHPVGPAGGGRRAGRTPARLVRPGGPVHERASDPGRRPGDGVAIGGGQPHHVRAAGRSRTARGPRGDQSAADRGHRGARAGRRAGEGGGRDRRCWPKWSDSFPSRPSCRRGCWPGPGARWRRC